MLDDKSLNGWLASLGKTGKAAHDASVREDWPCDGHDDIKILIEDISLALDEIIQSNDIEVIKALDNSNLLGLSALFSFPRTLRLINILGNADPDKLSSLTDRSLAIDEQSRLFIEMLYVRISYTARTCLMIKIFSRERVKIILSKLSENILKQSSNQEVVKSKETSKIESTTNEKAKEAPKTNFDDEGIDLNDTQIIKEDNDDEK
ncbi:hypothetical protein HNW13_018335 [Shewanella sp. BF02_Schw]|uniref:type IVB secretion system protein IcmW n=1 Tax=Shewanella sp. BF02_Schw TaxID=394908 RepID=UPI0017803595|nr:hypothetical protein [Shewanella sp. BF02_Schw]MBO1897700.1 hypothetical protein [Shewanella sp. BF02_Schw]